MDAVAEVVVSVVSLRCYAVMRLPVQRTRYLSMGLLLFTFANLRNNITSKKGNEKYCMKDQRDDRK